MDADLCDDCTSGVDDVANDGPDNESDGLCDTGDPDDDNDGVDDGLDSEPFNEFVCRDADTDLCDDCTSGVDDVTNDGPDNDSDGLCDTGDPDDDNDGVDDGLDSEPFNQFACRDADADLCDDCTSGIRQCGRRRFDDTDSDGACDTGDPGRRQRRRARHRRFGRRTARTQFSLPRRGCGPVRRLHERRPTMWPTTV